MSRRCSPSDDVAPRRTSRVPGASNARRRRSRAPPGGSRSRPGARVSNIWLYLRLLGATLLVLAPGIAFARALGVKGVSAALAWALTLLFGALAVTFALES